MKIMVNEKTYNDSSWSYNERGEASLLIKTDETISEIASTFDGNDVIHAFDDNDVETGSWFVHTLLAIYESYESHPEGEPRVVVLTLKITALTEAAEETINNSIDENVDAIIEIAEMVADMEDAQVQINEIKGILEGIPNDLVARFNAVNNAYNALADRVARLENQVQ